MFVYDGDCVKVKSVVRKQSCSATFATRGQMTASRVCDENGVIGTRQRKELVVEVKVCVQQYGAIALGKRRQGGKLFISTSPAADIAESSLPGALLLD